MTKQLNSVSSSKEKRKNRKKLTPQDINIAIASFEKFKIEVDQEFDAWAFDSHGSSHERDKLLNGSANVAAFSLIDESVRKAHGIFFSGHELANQVANKIAHFLKMGASVIDPACGAGDLLLACARLYPKQEDYESTIKFWRSKLGGIDLHSTFIATVTSRLKLLATESYLPSQLTKDFKATQFDRLLVGDAFHHINLVDSFDHIVTNPPYGYIDTPEEVVWATGKIQLAALFIDRLLSNSRQGQNIVAVLPDVLRSGTRYGKWRDWVAQRARVISIDIVGKFDKNTDVDVFIVHLECDQDEGRKWPEIEVRNILDDDGFVRVEEICNVRTGPVVPHRGEETGPAKFYIDSFQTSGFNEVQPTQERKFVATKYKGPFVVLNRTSSPDDPNRMVCTVINTKRLVLVENHLIILQPKDGRLETCRKLAKVLKEPYVKNWVNQKIRCRHLTVAVIKEIPLDWSA